MTLKKKITELLSTGHSTANVCLWRLHGCVLNFIHLSATGLVEITESTNLKQCPHTFVYIELLILHLLLYLVVNPELVLGAILGFQDRGRGVRNFPFAMTCSLLT